MEIETLSQILILWIHAPLGGIALLAGGIALISKKGKKVHRIAGLIFYYAMLCSASAAFVISFMPNHESPFLFCIGVFSTYFLLGGYRSLKMKHKNHKLNADKAIALIMVVVGFAMIAYPFIFEKRMNIILLVFGIAGIGFGIRDLRLFRNPTLLQEKWLKLHVAKMTGGYIASVTAFFVVNQFLPHLFNWFLPGLLGAIYIRYWMRRLDRKRSLVNRN